MSNDVGELVVERLAVVVRPVEFCLHTVGLVPGGGNLADLPLSPAIHVRSSNPGEDPTVGLQGFPSFVYRKPACRRLREEEVLP